MRAAWNVPRHLALIALAGWTSTAPLCADVNGGPAAPAPPNDATRGSGSSAEAPRRVTLDFVEAEIADIAKALSLQSGVNIACSANTKGKITLRQKNITLDEALQLVSRLAGLDYRKVGDTFIIGNPDELRSILARSGVTDVWTPQNLSLAEAKELVQAAAPFVTVSVQEKSHRVVLLGTAQDVLAARAFLTQTDAATAAPQVVVAPQFVTRMVGLKYLDPESAVSILTGGEKGKKGTASLVSDPAADGKPVAVQAGGNLFPTVDVRIAPEPYAPPAANFKPLSTDTKAIASSTATSSAASGANGQPVSKARSLILQGPIPDVARAVDFLATVDVAPPQVLIEARLVEVSPEKSKQLGLLFDYSQTTFQEMRTPRGTASGGDVGDHGVNFGRFIRTPFDINVTLSALEENRAARLLANPRISVIDGEDASIFIGDLLRFRVLQSVTSGGNEQFTVEEVPVGIALLVRPRVHADGNVTLKVHPVVSTVTSFVGPEKIPQTATREADSTIRMKDGETVVIGGLMREEDITIMSKVPGLGDLPLIGKLFQNKNSNKRKTEVTVFLTAHIMK
jgi:type II secretory pathway component GspD/PulD (secretin)